MEISREEIYWHYFCLSETFRKLNIDPIFCIDSLYEKIPYGVIKDSIRRRNATAVCDWVVEYLGYEFDDELDKWVLKDDE